MVEVLSTVFVFLGVGCISAAIIALIVKKIKQVILCTKIKKTIYDELVARAPEKTAKELQEYLKVIKKG